MTEMTLSMAIDVEKQFVKSAAEQLSHQIVQFKHNIGSYNQEGDWIGKKEHNNLLLTEFEEALLCGIMVSQLGSSTAIYDVDDTWSKSGYMSKKHVKNAITGFARTMHRHIFVLFIKSMDKPYN